MRKLSIKVALVASLVGVASFSTPSRAETGQVAVVFTKGGFIVGVGGGESVLTFRGKRYPFTVSGMSVGFLFDGASLLNEQRETAMKVMQEAADKRSRS
jgi:hypothetical protein